VINSHENVEAIVTATSNTTEKEGMMGYYDENHTAQDDYGSTHASTRRARLDKQIEDAITAANHLNETLIRLTTEREALNDWPERDPFIDTQVLAFKGRSYDYAAIRVNGFWYVTGTQSRPAMRWARFITWLADQHITYKDLTVLLVGRTPAGAWRQSPGITEKHKIELVDMINGAGNLDDSANEEQG
jgi:hypothetical protein